MNYWKPFPYCPATKPTRDITRERHVQLLSALIQRKQKEIGQLRQQIDKALDKIRDKK